MENILIQDIFNILFDYLNMDNFINLSRTNSSLQKIIINQDIYGFIKNFYLNFIHEPNNKIPIYIGYFIGACKLNNYKTKYLINHFSNKYNLEFYYHAGFYKILKLNNLPLISWYFQKFQYYFGKLDINIIAKLKPPVIKLLKYLTNKDYLNPKYLKNYISHDNIEILDYIFKNNQINQKKTNKLLKFAHNNRYYFSTKYLLSNFKFDIGYLNNFIINAPKSHLYMTKLISDITNTKIYNNTDLFQISCYLILQDINPESNLNIILELLNQKINKKSISRILYDCVDYDKLELAELIINKKNIPLDNLLNIFPIAGNFRDFLVKKYGLKNIIDFLDKQLELSFFNKISFLGVDNYIDYLITNNQTQIDTDQFIVLLTKNLPLDIAKKIYKNNNIVLKKGDFILSSQNLKPEIIFWLLKKQIIDINSIINLVINFTKNFTAYTSEDSYYSNIIPLIQFLLYTDNISFILELDRLLIISSFISKNLTKLIINKFNLDIPDININIWLNIRT